MTMQHVLAILAPFIDLLLPLAGGTLLGVGSFAAKRAADWLKLSNDSQVRTYLMEVVERAVAWAVAEVGRRIAAGGHDPDRDATAEDLAAGYVAERMPDALKHFGITPEGLRQIIQTRLSGS